MYESWLKALQNTNQQFGNRVLYAMLLKNPQMFAPFRNLTTQDNSTNTSLTKVSQQSTSVISNLNNNLDNKFDLTIPLIKKQFTFEIINRNFNTKYRTNSYYDKSTIQSDNLVNNKNKKDNNFEIESNILSNCNDAHLNESLFNLNDSLSHTISLNKLNQTSFILSTNNKKKNNISLASTNKINNFINNSNNNNNLQKIKNNRSSLPIIFFNFTSTPPPKVKQKLLTKDNELNSNLIDNNNTIQLKIPLPSIKITTPLINNNEYNKNAKDSINKSENKLSEHKDSNQDSDILTANSFFGIPKKKKRSMDILMNTKFYEFGDQITQFFTSLINLMKQGQNEQVYLITLNKIFYKVN